MKLHTYLNYGGNCEEAFKFYEKHLGGKIVALMRFKDSPPHPGGEANSPEGVLHARLALGEAMVMASDVPDGRFEPMRSVYLSLETGSDAEAERIYAMLAEGGQVFIPMQETFFASRFGQLRDRFGTSWMILHERPMPAAA
jgi:PhnB protein